MTYPNWAIPGAQVFLSKPTTAQEAAAAELARRTTAHGTPEEIRAQREREAGVLLARHQVMLATAADPILRALVEAHGPVDRDCFQTCAACPEEHDDYGSEPAGWPCSVWSFVSNRMEKP